MNHFNYGLRHQSTESKSS